MVIANDGFLFHVSMLGNLDHELKSRLPETEAPAILYRYRIVLRSLTENFEAYTVSWTRFVSLRIGSKVTESHLFLRVEQERSQTYKEASRLELEIRYELQLRVGQSSLVESKKSIEASDSHLQEAKRGEKSCKSISKYILMYLSRQYL